MYICTIRRSFVVIAAAAFIIESSLFSTLSALLPHYEEELGMSSFASGVLAASYTGGMVAGTLLAGLWLNDRLGVRPTALAGAGLLAAASLAFGAVDVVWQLDLARTIQGVGAGMLWCSLLNWLILVVPAERRGAAIGGAMGAAVFGTAVGPLLGAATQLVGTFTVFALVSGVVLGLAVLLVLAESPPLQRSSVESRIGRLRVPAVGSLRGIAAMGFVPPIVGGAVITLVPLDLADFGASDTRVAVVLLIAALLAAIACPLSGRWGDRVGDRQPMIVGLAIGCAALVGMAAATGSTGLAISFAAYQGIALSVSWIPLMSLFTARAEAAGMSAAGAAIILNLTVSSGYTFGPLAATAMAELGGISAPYVALVAVSAAALAVTVAWPGFSSAYGRRAAIAEEAAG